MPSSHPYAGLRLLLRSNNICQPCRRRLSRQACSAGREYSSITINPSRTGTFGKEYFLANNLYSSGGTAKWVKLSEPTRFASAPSTQSTSDLPHRRRRRKHAPSIYDEDPHDLPPDASSSLSSLSSTHALHSPRQRALAFLALTKPRLTFLMVLTTTTAYSLFPVAISPFSSTMHLSPTTLLTLTIGTALASASANTLNMFLEPAHDAKMSRTRARPLVRGLLTSRAALIFAILCGASGITILYTGTNPTVAFLGAANIVLYAGVYTPLKRIHPINTWVGALVGGIPPLMGWAAASYTSQFHDRSNPPTWRDLLLDPSAAGGWLLAGLLFAWQFPHFNAIAYTIRHEYAAAGYRMLSSTNVRMTGRIAVRYSAAMFPLCAGLAWVGVTSPSFVVTSGLVNAWMLRDAVRFLKHEGARGSARALFWSSVWHLPLVLVLAMAQKRGLWERFVRGGLDEDELREALQE